MPDIFPTIVETVKSEFHDADIEEIRIKQKPAISVSWKALDDNSRPFKRYQTIVIKLHEDFGTSEFAHRPLSETRVEFTKFIRKKRSQFKPQPTGSLYETPSVEYWIFPPEC